VVEYLINIGTLVGFYDDFYLPSGAVSAETSPNPGDFG
jgi:hypothetical protein